MNRRVFAALAAFLALSACGSVQLGAPLLAGRWEPVDARWGGQDYPVANWHGTQLELTQTAYEFGADKGTYTTLGGRTPPHLDIHGTQGPNAGRNIPAIYSLSGDRLAICYQLGAGERPADFVSPAGSQVLLVHYRRAP
jgi:uncharacterized protein (TIGR03067 family)